ncbi:hypothetical protein BW31_01443 [Pantoea agglomerans]|uniref:DUF4238 domain-containing protein n=1 Tax=Enterobacter agglomerans TaxID=549 RepID=UPI0004510D3E|nr:DUF4238 domain-containing protein [Pantoea agglomerans]EZI34400.1 hypothetical protein BW31_01443 [Pantoea agglomerans]
MKERMQVTKRQHYVFRKYLKSWADTNSRDPQLSTLDKNTKKTFRSGLMGVAQQNYFYELKVLSEVEKMVAIILSTSKYELLNDNDPYFTIREVEAINLAERIEASKPNSSYPSNYFNDLRRQLGEDKQSRYEEVGQKFIDLLLEEDANFYIDDRGRIDFTYFFIMQYVRTKAMRESLNNIFSDIKKDHSRLIRLIDFVSKKAKVHRIPFDKEKAQRELERLDDNLVFSHVSPFIIYSTVDELVYAFAHLNKMNLYIVKAHQDINFITGDQPVINIHFHSSCSHQEVNDLEFYYPLSPSTAIILNFPNHDEWPDNLSKEQTIELNQKIYEAAHRQVYAFNAYAFQSLRI